MKTETGKLKKTSKGFLLTLATKKGTADFQIPGAAFCFRTEDAADAMEVDVVRDDQNRIVKVTIPGKNEVAPQAAAAPSSRPGQRPGNQRGGGNQGRTGGYGGHVRSQPPALSKLPKARPIFLGLPFHNPYTFLPFGDGKTKFQPITAHSADELPDEDRYTGVIELEVKTESPLLTCAPDPVEEKNGHKTYSALTIGLDVILPASGVRGALRTLMTVLTGGTLGYVDEHAFLCQGRDLNLGPRGPSSSPSTPEFPMLAEVERPGNAFRDGTVRIGQTKLVSLTELERQFQGVSLPRGPRSPELWVGLDSDGHVTHISNQKDSQTPWKLKLSGRPVNVRGKREGVFLQGNDPIVLPAKLWADYSGRNVHGDRPELKPGDLIWIEPRNPELKQIRNPEDVQGIHWARWARKGESLLHHVEKNFPHVLPEYLGKAIGDDKGKVDEVTNLFGQVSPKSDAQVKNFAGRIRPENLVFFDAVARIARKVHLAPLVRPHPGCIGFYRDNPEADAISDSDLLRGYKVYRTTNESGNDAPWLFSTQGVYNAQGKLESPQQKVNKTVDLVPAGQTGSLRIAFRSLSKRELALMLQACHVTWRLGGGKPLGLGWCSIKVKSLIGEDGLPLGVAGWDICHEHGECTVHGWRSVVHDLEDRVRMWATSQLPVAKLRYPRSVDDNNHRKSRGGHTWFQRHASPRMTTAKGDNTREPGLQPLHVDGKLKQRIQNEGANLDNQYPMVSGQPLPQFNPDQPEGDALFGYDAIGADTETRSQPTRRVFLDLELFDESQHVSGREKSQGNHGKNADFRKQQKDDRRT